MQSRFTCGMLRFRTCAAVVQPRFFATRSAARLSLIHIFTAQREIKKKLRSILWVNYQIKDQEVFDKAYQYIEMYY